MIAGASPRFVEACQNGGGLVSTVGIRTNGVDLGDVPIADGRLTLDADAPASASLNLTVPVDDPRWLPMTKTADLFIVDTRCRVRIGWRFPNGDVETLLVASTWVTDLEVNRPNDRVILTAQSIEFRLVEDPFLAALTFGANATVRNAVDQIMAGTTAAGIVTTGGVDLTVQAPKSLRFARGDSRWAAIEQALQAANAVAYATTNDDLLVSPPLEVKPLPDVTLKTGEDGTVETARASFTRTGFGNKVRIVYSSQKKGTPNVVGTWDLNDPVLGASGRMGRIGLPVDRKGTVSQAVANDNAARYGRRRNAVPRDVTVTAIPDPRVQIGDTVRILYYSGGHTDFVVRRIEFPLVPAGGTMTLSGKGDSNAATAASHGG